MKKIIILIYGIAFMQITNAQSPLLDSAKNELYRINKVFDSSQYLGFDMDILYKSDSANVTVETDQMSGTYILNKKNLYYSMGGTEYIQTDSFSYTIYPEEKIMIMTKNFVVQNSDAFPLRTFIDSIMHYYALAYEIGIDTSSVDSVEYSKRISFSYMPVPGTDLVPPFKSFSIDYNDETYFPSRFQFSFNEPHPGDSTHSIMLFKTVTMAFSNYKAYNSTSVFNDDQYIIYNRQRKVYESAEKYKDYRFITSGFENEDEDAKYYREVPSTGN